MSDSQVLILGCGYTGKRLADRLLARGVPVVATTRSPDKLRHLKASGATVVRLDVTDHATLGVLTTVVAPGVKVLHSIPVVEHAGVPFDPTPDLLCALGPRPARMVYLSTTGVYGSAPAVDEHTSASPVNDHEQLRIAAEQAVAAGPWSSLILRPAAIYGPGRGVHESIRLGRYQLVGAGDNFVSRIHVEDLAVIVEAALSSQVTGTFPVADEEPCTTEEMARFCAGLLRLAVPQSVDTRDVHHTRRANRRVDGRAIARLLGIHLTYPSYRTGVPASL